MSTRRVKGSGGDLAVSATGTHAAYTGTHAHSHKSFGSQGGDEQHEHEHSHDGDAKHEHEHTTAKAVAKTPKAAPNGRQVRKARDFDTLFASLSASDQLQDDWGDTFIAFTHAMEELMWQGHAQNAGWLSDGIETVDVAAAAQANLDAFGKAVMALVSRSLEADFAPCLDYDGDQFLDPDGVNADEGEDTDDWKRRTGRNPLAMPDAPALMRKAGREISGANRQVITDALDGMTKAMGDMKAHHGAIADLMTKTDPDRVRQDEANTQGDDDTENGGTNINKSRRPDTDTPSRRTAAEHPSQAGTTHQANNQGVDLTAFDADYDALKSRLTMAGKAHG